MDRSSRWLPAALLVATVLLVPAGGWSGVIDSVKKNVKSAVGGAQKSVKGAVESAGSAVGSAIPDGWTEKKWKKERAKAKEERATLQSYEAPRRQIDAKGTKLAATPMRSKDVEPRVAFITDELLLTELFDAGFDAVGPDDINAVLGFDAMKQQLGSDDPQTLSEVGGALGVRYITAGAVADVDGALFVSLKLIDVETHVVRTRVSKIADDGAKALPRTVAEVVQELAVQSAM